MHSPRPPARSSRRPFLIALLLITTALPASLFAQRSDDSPRWRGQRLSTSSTSTPGDLLRALVPTGARRPRAGRRLVLARPDSAPRESDSAGGARRDSNDAAASPLGRLDSTRDALVFGADERTLVENTRVFPNAAVVFVESSFPSGETFAYSGFLISDFAVLTLGLALYDPLNGGFATAVRVVPGQYEDLGTILAPFGSQQAVEIDVPDRWVERGAPELNFGVALLEKSFEGVDAPLELGFNQVPQGDITIAGYDEHANAGTVSFSQWTRSGPLAGSDNLYFDHLLDVDDGTAGAPAWNASGGQPRVFGIDCCVVEGNTANAGIRFTSRNKALIEGWLGLRPISEDAEPLPLGASDRFEIVVAYTDLEGKQGTGTPVRITQDTGYFWFFSAANLETIFKVINGCSFNQHYWVFGAGLTNVEVQIEVRDTVTGAIRRYSNPEGQAFQPLQDTSAFATCP